MFPGESSSVFVLVSSWKISLIEISPDAVLSNSISNSDHVWLKPLPLTDCVTVHWGIIHESRSLS